MVSTFHGLETARRGMVTQQSALYTTGHNIANASTPGYTRQRVNFTQTNPYPSPGLNTAKIPGQVGTGVEAGTIQRVRESFLDVQFRGEQTKTSYWDTRANALGKMEEIMNEPSETGLANTLNQFWQSLQDLAANPEDQGARSVVRQRGEMVANTFTYLSNSLTAIKDDFGKQISVTVKSVNSLSDQISRINKQISEIEPVGYLPNDLYDERDRLIDELSKYVEIKVHPPRSSGGDSLPVAEGILDISIVGDNGTETKLIDGSTFKKLSVDPATDSDGDGVNDQPTSAVTGFQLDGQDIPFIRSGEMKAIVETYGYVENGAEKGIYPKMLDDLDKMAYSFATQFNAVHSQGFTLKTSTEASVQGGDFFEPFTGTGANAYKGAAATIKVSSNIDNLSYIAVSTIQGESGNGYNATNLANVKNANFGTLTGFPITAGSVQSYYESLIGSMGVDSQEAIRMSENSAVLKDSVENRRQSVSAVSLDEEMTNMIKFQHAYNGSARMITVLDEMLERIINGLGTGGR
ncbi:flagellar hook-associated protein FlgK [Bacillus timonensis]|uniref:Flagellar hook-associated protein 1 n=1 Tax=Bacillus timonensis TaxID=1033734 RepID=A0A4S3PTY0_9BACI|nr:flagellar hook-associated protein FlgK [Bacillus timonensis]THE12342.1 flagellar hook-associated protein FlgK [Bacillus timonensis]